MNLRRFALLLSAAGLVTLSGCPKSGETVLLKVTTDDPSHKVDQYDLYVWETQSHAQVLHTGWTDATNHGKKNDFSQDPLQIGLTMPNKTPMSYTLMMVGVIGTTDGDKPAASAKQFFFAKDVSVDGNVTVDAQLLSVPDGDDMDRDLWPDGDPTAGWLTHNAQAAQAYASSTNLLDCDDKMAQPSKRGGSVAPEQIHPFATEICGDGVDEACNGDADEKCTDTDNDGDPDCMTGDDPKTCDCAPSDPKRHHPIKDPTSPSYDPFPESPNCCGYNFGLAGTDATTKEGACNSSPCMAGALCHTDNSAGDCDDGIDQDCDGVDTACAADNDCDGYNAGPQPGNPDSGDGPACNAPVATPPGNDCNDCSADIHPQAQEICGDGIDNNCNGVIDEGCVSCDLDGDGFQRMDTTHAQKCPDPTYLASGKKIDCNDEDSGVYPGSTTTKVPLPYLAGLGLDTCSGKEGGTAACAIRAACRNLNPSQTPQDADCDGTAALGCPNSDPKLLAAGCDMDGDGFVDAKKPACNTGGLQTDCDDSDPHIFPQAPEKCGDGVTQNCNGQDVACSQDADKDGYNSDTDCNDNDPSIHPWATETCNGKDDDCDGLVDEGNPDATGKPMVDTANKTVTHCNDSSTGECGTGPHVGDCVCSVQSLKGSFFEQAKRVSCPGEVSVGTMTPPPPSSDEGAAAAPRCYFAYQPQPQSCDPTNPKDDDCDGHDDDPTGKNLQLVIDKALCWPGAKGQCLGAATAKVVGCDRTQANCFNKFGVTPKTANDAAGNPWIVCDTVDANKNPVICPQAELCNGLDDSCDGVVPVVESDADKDHYLACGGDPAAGYMLAPEPCQAKLAAGLLGCGDCNDANPNMHPTATETCNNVDDDCDTRTGDGSGQCGVAGAAPTCCSAQAAAAGAGPTGGTQFCHNLQTETNNCGACTTPGTMDRVCDAVRANLCTNGGCTCGAMGSPCAKNASTGMSSDWCNAGACQPCTTNAHCGPNCITCPSTTPQCKADATQCVECNADADCSGFGTCGPSGCWCDVSGSKGAANKCIAKVTLGTPCVPNTTSTSGDNQCTSGNCVDGFCCNTAASQCSGCKACIGALTVGGINGTCDNVKGGLAPTAYPSFHADPCTASVANCKLAACAGDGTCNSASGTSCGATSCGSLTETDPTCDNAGACKMPTKSCNGFVCNGASTLCLTTCASDNDCANGGTPATTYYCNKSGVCILQKSQGSVCVNANDCIGGTACRECGTPGGCVDGYCCDKTCTNGCDYCNLGGQQGTCSVAAVGNAGAPSCTPYLCNGASASCPTTCSADGDCISADYCSSTACTPKIANGGVCTASNQCQSGNCQPAQSGMRCKATSGPCTTCLVVSSTGACVPASGGTDPKGDCTSACFNNCNGSSGACAFQAGGTTCGGGGFACSGSSGTCPTSCTVGSDVGCDATHYCVGGNTCTPKLGNGSVCSASDQCSSGSCQIAQSGMRCKSTAGACATCNVVDSSGSCVPANNGTDPQNACPTGGCNNFCQSGACAVFTLGTTCGSGFSCTGVSATCPTVCTVGTDVGCDSSHYCVGGTTCTAKVANGGTCTASDQCTSGSCQPANDSATGKRCKSTAGPCAGCQGTDSAGTCANVTMTGFDPNGFCTGQSCANGCNTSNACQPKAGGATCGAGFACDGSTTICPASCTVGTDAGCDMNHYCVGGTTCTAKIANGGTCTASNTCSSGNCQPANDSASGLRCKSTAGACTGCQGTNSSGSCANVTTAGFDPNGNCTQACQSGCTTSNTCRIASSSTNCGTGSLCDGTNPACPASCAADTGCQASYYCGGTGGTCTSRVGTSGTCDTRAAPPGDCKVTGCRECANGACSSSTGGGTCP